ncbi:hypothetical protein [Agrobacterium tumefaciens]|uniref:hypothetical protein n=1 Tax=Agrobacterium tumefaciens TaxID=358 RepID=UPI0030133AC2
MDLLKQRSDPAGKLLFTAEIGGRGRDRPHFGKLKEILHLSKTIFSDKPHRPAQAKGAAMIFDVVGRGTTPISTRCCSRKAAATRGRHTKKGRRGIPAGPLILRIKTTYAANPMRGLSPSTIMIF